MSDREKAIRRMGEGMDFPPEVIDEIVSWPPSTRWAEPVIFPNPPDETTARRIEEAAEQVQEEFPYRTLLDCRELAARLVDAVLTWDAMWPEAEGDCACSGVSHDDRCPHWSLPL